MNISQTATSFTSQTSASQLRRQGPPPGGKEQLSSALESIGVDDSTAAKVLEQIDTAIATLDSESTSGRASRQAVRSVVDQVLESNGIDKAEVGDAIQSAELSGIDEGSRGGRPRGPRPPRRDNESETSAVESALISAGVEESSTDEWIDQIIGTIQELTTDSGSNVSQDELRKVLTNLFEENGVDFNTFEQAFANEFGSAGSFLDVLA